DLIISGEIFKQISALLEPGLKSGDLVSSGSVVIGTVADDIHEIGKNIVITMLKSSNFEVVDLGANVAPEKFVEALGDTGAGVLGLSGLLTLAFDSMRETVEAVRDAGLAGRVKVMIGGGPVDENIRKLVGADDWGADAQAAVRLARLWSEQAHV
ncbi:MAG: cobalamin-dependent protein, partial [Rhodospirillales bacterium]|nr:cobalamin-dependent protein [Rhodospirillales bacterium]